MGKPMTTEPGQTEVDVARVALAELSAQWPEHWTEVPSMSGRVDAVGRDADGGLHAVEFKRQASLAFVVQGVDRIAERAFSSVLLVVGQSRVPRAWNADTGVAQMVRLGAVLGFGVGMVRGTTFHIELPPQPLPFEPGPRDYVSAALNDIHRQCASEAGNTSSAYWTAWKQGLHDLEAAVRADPGITVAKLRYKLAVLGVLYWRNENAQIRTLAEQCRGVRAEFTGREYRYFPADPEEGAHG